MLEIPDVACGIVASGLARLCVAPLDLLKIRLQVDKTPLKNLGFFGESRFLSFVPRVPFGFNLLNHVVHMIRTEGPLTFWNGNGAAQIMTYIIELIILMIIAIFF